MAKTKSTSYKQAGVNIDEADRAVASIRTMARRTFNPAVLTDIGSFGGGYLLKGYRNPVLVSSA
jgi:phosphoribosylformylglycinamidine cyclo-ligase